MAVAAALLLLLLSLSLSLSLFYLYRAHEDDDHQRADANLSQEPVLVPWHAREYGGLARGHESGVLREDEEQDEEHVEPVKRERVRE